MVLPKSAVGICFKHSLFINITLPLFWQRVFYRERKERIERMLTSELCDILNQWREDNIPVLVCGADIKQIRFDEKVQMIVLDSEEIEIEKGQHILWEAE